MDLGECSKIHDLALRADYEIASKERDLFFELDVSYLILSRAHLLVLLICSKGVLSSYAESLRYAGGGSPGVVYCRL